MPIELNELEKSEIFLTIKKAFSDFKYFDKIELPLQQVIHDSTTKYEIDYDRSKTILDYIPDRDHYKTKEQTEILTKFRIILTAGLILIYAHHPNAERVKYHSISELLQHYPEYSFLQGSTVLDDQKELDYLLKFRNFMAIALLIITAKSNKLFLLKVIERLEGSNNEYITGSGQKLATTRRLEIYKKEATGIPVFNSAIPLEPAPLPIPTVFTAQKKRKVDELHDASLPTKSEHQPSNSQSSVATLSLPSSQEDVHAAFARSHTYRVIEASNSNDGDDRNAALSSTPPLSRANSLLRYASEVDDLFKVDTLTEEALLSEDYKGSFSATIERELGKR